MRALFGGLGDVLRAPALVIMAIVAMMLVVAPFALALGQQLQRSLSQQQPVAAGSAEIDADWWQEFLEHADGLAATFTPTIIGAAAPLDNLSALLDGTARPLALLAPVAITIVVWAFLWGAALDRFARGARAVGLWRAGLRAVRPFTLVSLLAAAVVVLLYYTAHPLLFDVVGPLLVSPTADERTAFAVRAALYVIFGAALVTVGVTADYARIQLTLTPGLAATDGIRGSWRFVRAHAGHVLGLYLLTGTLFIVLVAGYAALDVAGAASVGGWRGIALAQAYIVARIVVRLTFAASEVRLYRALVPDQGAS